MVIVCYVEMYPGKSQGKENTTHLKISNTMDIVNANFEGAGA